MSQETEYMNIFHSPRNWAMFFPQNNYAAAFSRDTHAPTQNRNILDSNLLTRPLRKLPKTQRIKRYGIWKLVAVRRILWARRNGTNWIVNWWYFYALYYHIIFGLRCGSWLFVVPNKNMEYAVIVLNGISVGRQTSSLRGWRFYWFKKIFVWINNWKIATTLLLVERVWVRHRNL